MAVGLPSHPFSPARSWVVAVARGGFPGAGRSGEDCWEVQFWHPHLSSTVPAWFSCGRRGRSANSGFPGRREVRLSCLMVQLLQSQQGWEEEQLKPVWLRAKPGRVVPLSQLSGAPPWEGDKLVGMPHQWHEVRRGWGAGGNFFLVWGDLGETLFIFIFRSCGRGWADSRLCNGREQTEVGGERGAPSVSERIESWRGSSLREDRALVVCLISSLPWGTSFKGSMFSQLLNCLLCVCGEGCFIESCSRL